MNRTWWKRHVSRKPRAAAQTRHAWLFLEKLEDRCVPTVAVGVYSPVTEVGNNAANPYQGVSFTTVAGAEAAGTTVAPLSGDLVRVSAAAYADGISKPSMGGKTPTFVPSPRTVSNDVFNQASTLFGPASTDVNTVNGNGLSDFGYTFGQFMDHDMDLTPDGGAAFNIPVDPAHPNDPIASLLFTRSQADPNTGTGTSNPLQQINVNTSYLDLSQVYGSTTTVEMALRTGSGGLLKTSPGNMLPFDSSTTINPATGQPYFTADQVMALNMANSGPLPEGSLYAAGDVRANENTELTSLQTLFMRNHNAIATQLATEDPTQYGFSTWNDENLYQEARKLNIAEYQNIIYTQYLPALLGPNYAPQYTGYNPSVNASIMTEFSTVAFRFGHSLLNNTVNRDANDGSSAGAVPLAQDFFDPTLVNPTPTFDPTTGLYSTDIGAYLKGDADGTAQAVDSMAVSNIRNLLFETGTGSTAGGEDLISRDIWRAHDDGIGTYNQVRVAFGLPAITNDATHGFDQITSNVQVQQELETAYSTMLFSSPGVRRTHADGTFFTAGDIDPFAGGMAEDHVAGSDMGPLFTTILATQFSNLENGDQFFYLNESFIPAEQAIAQQGSTLGQIITTNTGVTNLQSDVFLNPVLSQQNGVGKGFFTNKNGENALTGSKTGTTLTLYSSLILVLDPKGTGTTALVDSFGNHLSDTFFQSYSNIQSFLTGGGSNMANKLSQQLLTTELNVNLGYVNSTTNIYVPAVGTLSSTLQNSLSTNGVSNSAGVANIQNILNAAITELATDPNPAPGSADAIFQEALMDCLAAVNNNEDIFIL